MLLSLEEVEQLFKGIDHSKPEGQRNRAILETMYSSGLRVSEVIALGITNLYLDVGFIRVIGKGNKERLVPIGDEAARHIGLYREHVRNKMIPAKRPGRYPVSKQKRQRTIQGNGVLHH